MKTPLILDGAISTMLGSGGEACEMLCLTAPERVAEVHRCYIDAGADILTTNTFNCSSLPVAQRLRAAEAAIAIARGAAGESGVLVAGNVGPMCSVDDARTIAGALIAGGADLILVETIFDLTRAAAVLDGIGEAMRSAGRSLPLMLSATAGDDGRLPSGETLGQFRQFATGRGAWSLGLNCGSSPQRLIALVERLRTPGLRLSCHPCAGLPDAGGRYSISPEEFAETMRQCELDIAGGCCGTTPAHISAMRCAGKS